MAQLLCTLGDARAPPGPATEVSPAGLLSLLHALQWLLRLEASAVRLFTQHAQLAASLILLVQPAALGALARFVAATGGSSSNGEGAAHHHPHHHYRHGAGEHSLSEAVAAAAVGTLLAPFTHAHASPQAEAAVAQLQQALATHPGSVPGLLHCLEVAHAKAAGNGSEVEGAAAELLVPSVGLLARVVMASDVAMTQFVELGGMAPSMVDK